MLEFVLFVWMYAAYQGSLHIEKFDTYEKCMEVGAFYQAQLQGRGLGPTVRYKCVEEGNMNKKEWN